MLLEYIESQIPKGGRASVQLIAEKGKEAFYIKKGFKEIPHENCGAIMKLFGFEYEWIGKIILFFCCMKHIWKENTIDMAISSLDLRQKRSDNKLK